MDIARVRALPRCPWACRGGSFQVGTAALPAPSFTYFRNRGLDLEVAQTNAATGVQTMTLQCSSHESMIIYLTLPRPRRCRLESLPHESKLTLGLHAPCIHSAVTKFE
jgi:hypothetical protein